MIIYLNGELVKASESRIDPGDRGMTLGDGLYETIKAQNGQALRCDAHLARLRQGANILGIKLDLSDADIARAILATLKANAINDGVVRLTLTRGPAARGLLPADNPRATILIVPSNDKGRPSTPIKAIVASVTRRNEHSPLSRCKSTNCLDNILARQEARRRGADEAVLLNTAGRIAETTIANLFMVSGGAVLTPPISEGALPGIMRAEILQTIKIKEQPIGLDNLANASEVFVTNSLGIHPLISLDGKAIGNGQPGPITNSLEERQDYSSKPETLRR